MDQTNKYILMCEEATEIQKLRHYPKLSNWQELNELNSYSLDFDEGDFIAFNSNSYNGVNI